MSECLEEAEILQNLPVLRCRLGKAQTRVEYPVRYSIVGCLPPEFKKIFLQRLHYALRIIAEYIHCPRVAALVHCHVFKSETPDSPEHLRIILAGRYVIDDKRTDHIIGPADNFRTCGIYGHPA